MRFTGLQPDWASNLSGLQVKIVPSVTSDQFANGRFDNTIGDLVSCTSTLARVILGGAQESVNVDFIVPVEPDSQGASVMVIKGPLRGRSGKTLSKDGDEWLVDLGGDREAFPGKNLCRLAGRR